MFVIIGRYNVPLLISHSFDSLIWIGLDVEYEEVIDGQFQMTGVADHWLDGTPANFFKWGEDAEKMTT